MLQMVPLFAILLTIFSFYDLTNKVKGHPFEDDIYFAANAPTRLRASVHPIPILNDGENLVSQPIIECGLDFATTRNSVPEMSSRRPLFFDTGADVTTRMLLPTPKLYFLL